MTRHCYRCGWKWTLDGQPGRGQSCHECGADLRVCLNCVQYDRQVAHQCRERRAEPVMEKDQANFCEYFDFALRVFGGKGQPDTRETQARDRLKKLLGGD